MFISEVEIAENLKIVFFILKDRFSQGFFFVCFLNIQIYIYLIYKKKNNNKKKKTPSQISSGLRLLEPTVYNNGPLQCVHV